MRFLILHGWQGSGPDHWQAWLTERLRAAGHDVAFPVLPDPDHPDLDAWLGAIESLRADGQVVVCHSLGCCLWLHHRARGGPPAERVLLVAPPCPVPMPPEIAGFFPVPLKAELAEEVTLICSDDDPYCPGGAAAAFGEPLEVEADLRPGIAHINPETGFGPFPDAERWCVSPSGPRNLGPSGDAT